MMNLNKLIVARHAKARQLEHAIDQVRHYGELIEQYRAELREIDDALLPILSQAKKLHDALRPAVEIPVPTAHLGLIPGEEKPKGE